MAITYFQLLGALLIYGGVHGFIKGKFEWEARVGSGDWSDATFNLDLTSEKYRKTYKGEVTGKWIKPFCVVLATIGLVLVFVYPGEYVAFNV